MNTHFIRIILCLSIGACVALAASEGKRGRDKGREGQPKQDSACLDVPTHSFDIVLGRVSRDSVTLSVLTYQDIDGYLAYGTARGTYSRQTKAQRFKKNEPVEIVLEPLQRDTTYFYEFRTRNEGKSQGTFHTQRPPGGAGFTFTITADSHLDDRASSEVYLNTLGNALADKPDFHLDLGDTFMTEKHENRENAFRQYVAQRFYFSRLCNSAPLYLVLGNHDGESPRGQGSEADDLAVWSNSNRKQFFPNPVPSGFYSGNEKKHPQAGLLQDYYAWEWGDALFIVLDPFWYTQKQRGQHDNWKHTLGEDQYRWLERVLKASKARWKFVFIHHLVGGADEQCRGGSEAVPFYEWGGKNADGSDGFAEHRPGWTAPIHELLKRQGVSIVFHGHDHLYAKQDVDGIVYQEVPQPGAESNGKPPRFAEEYGYKAGTILGGSGHMRIAVSAGRVVADYVSSVLPADEATARRNRGVAHSYILTGAGR